MDQVRGLGTAMRTHDGLKDPAVVLPYLLGRPLPATEVHAAFGYRKSSYYKAAKEGRLLSADNVIRVAKHFDLNTVDLLVRFGLIAFTDVVDYVAIDQSNPDPLPNLAVGVRRCGPRENVASSCGVYSRG